MGGPVFIGGSNGSGTRVYATLMDAAGVFQGREQNYAFEPEAILRYTRSRVPELMAQTRSPVYEVDALPPPLRNRTVRWLDTFSQALRDDRPPPYSRWGWKHPRNLYLLPFLHRLFPDAHFVHVVRDGRDMSLADNKGDFRTMNVRFGSPYPDTPAGAAAFWSDVNTEVARWGDAHLGPRYVRSRFEDLCADPEEESSRILGALDLAVTDGVERLCADFVKTPATSGRWRSLEEPDRSEVLDAASSGLRNFGYAA
ncbi:MAG: sulfotransferase [Litorimonas sp.]